MVASARATLSHQVVGWKRSSTIRQPPDMTIAMVEAPSAFIWNSGSGVSMRSVPGCRVQ